MEIFNLDGRSYDWEVESLDPCPPGNLRGVKFDGIPDGSYGSIFEQLPSSDLCVYYFVPVSVALAVFELSKIPSAVDPSVIRELSVRDLEDWEVKLALRFFESGRSCILSEVRGVCTKTGSDLAECLFVCQCASRFQRRGLSRLQSPVVNVLGVR